ncbi:DUF1080 domain-containing protein, partial [Blautia wexlerae]|nr:DUF1080 domain-containing protein [Blautia wexlerae]
PTAVGETHRLRMVAVGSRIRVYLDDETEPRVDVYDGTYASGSVALRGFRCKGVFDNVVVSTAPRYEADFENGGIAEWAATGAAWSNEDGQMAASGKAAALVGNAGWTDYEYAADVTPAAGSRAGLAVRAITQKERLSGYYVALDEKADKLQVIRSMSGVETVLAETDLDVAADTVYNLKVRAVNNTLRVYVDGAKEAALTVTDNDFFNGKAGLAVLEGAASFDNVVVKDQFIFEENFADGSLNGWNIVSGDVSVNDNTLYIAKGAGKKLVDGYATWSDYVLKAKIKLDIDPNAKSNAGFVFRSSDFAAGQDDLYGYVLGINYSENNPKPLERTGLEFGDLHYGWRAIANTTDFVMDPNAWYDFEVKAEGNKITVSVDGKEYYTAEDSAYTYGMFGLRNFNAALHVKNLVVAPVSELAVEEPSEHMLTASYNSNVSLYIDGDNQRLADLIGAYKDVVMAGDKLSLEFRPRLDGRELAGVTLNGEALQVKDTGSFVYDLTMPNEDTTLAFQFTVVNKTNLRSVIAIAEDCADEAAEAVPSVQKKFEKALKEAKAAEEKLTATQKEIDDAMFALIDAMHYLSFTEGDKSKLTVLMEIADALDRSFYTEESLAKVDEAYAVAKELVDDDEVLEADVNAAEEALNEALITLVRITDKSDLAAKIETAEGLELDKYLEVGKKEVAAALEKAYAVMENPDATQKEINDAVNELSNAMTLLRLIPNKDALKENVGKAEAIDTSKYTAASVRELKDTLDEANDVLANPQATQEEVDAVNEKLTRVMNSLVPKSSSKPSGNKTSSSSSVPSNAYGADGMAVAGATVAQAASVISDTTVNFTLKRGSAYCFKMTVVNGSALTPSFTVGNGDVL